MRLSLPYSLLLDKCTNSCISTHILVGIVLQRIHDLFHNASDKDDQHHQWVYNHPQHHPQVHQPTVVGSRNLCEETDEGREEERGGEGGERGM